MSKTRKDSGKNKLWVSVFIVAIMVLSSLGIIFSGYVQENPKIEYNKYQFTQDSGYLTTKVNKTLIKIQSYPQDLERIQIDDSIISLIRSTHMMYISYPLAGPYKDYSGMASLATIELGDFLAERGIYYVSAISDNNTGYESIPLITCANATPEIPVIIFMNATNISNIEMENNCIRIQASTPLDFIRIKDKLILLIAGIA